MKSVLVIGAGQFGTHIAKRMEELRCEVMAVDMNEDCVNNIMPYVTNAIALGMVFKIMFTDGDAGLFNAFLKIDVFN